MLAAIGVSAACTLASLDALAVWLEFDRQAILAGQWWRLFTGHFAHFGWLHLISNLLYLLVFTFLLRSQRISGCLGYIVFASVVVPGALLLESPGLDYYRGLSALLYGLTVWCALVLAADGRRVLYAVPLVISVFIVLDMSGFAALRSPWSPVPVYPAAHLYAVAAALVWYFVAYRSGRKTA